MTGLWSCLPSAAAPLASGLQVWAGWLDIDSPGLTGFHSLLSSQERARACRFILQRDQARFIAARGLLRVILSSCLGAEPGALEFDYSPRGKPSLAGAFARRGLQFNLAHSGGLAVFAVARYAALGVDVEQVRPIPHLSQVIEHSFSAHERAELGRREGKEAVTAFFQLWTRKEAWLKATGQGIADMAHLREVLGRPVEKGPLPQGPGCMRETRMRLQDLAPAPGFVGALALTP